MFCQNAVIFSIQYIINSNLVISITVGICTTIIIRRPNTPLMDSILCQCLVCKQRQIMPFIRPTIGFIQYNRIFITHELGAISPQFYGNRLRYVCFTPILFHTNRCEQFRLVSIQQCSTTVLDFNPTTIRYQACRTIAGHRTDNSTISSHNNFNHVCRVIPHGNDFMQLIRTTRKFYPEITVRIRCQNTIRHRLRITHRNRVRLCRIIIRSGLTKYRYILSLRICQIERHTRHTISRRIIYFMKRQHTRLSIPIHETDRLIRRNRRI